MIDFIRFGTIIKPLEKRFKALTKEQAEVYHSTLRYVDEDLFRLAIEHLVDVAKSFPTPAEIKIALREVAHRRIKDEKTPFVERGCSRCKDGYVFYTNSRGMFINDCANCHNHEVTIIPQMIQVDNKIYYACETFKIEGRSHYRAAPEMTEIYEEAKPFYTSEELKAHFESPSMQQDYERW